MAAPAHRSVSNIRPSVTSGLSNTGPPGSPHTPLRAISSNFASPSTLRAEEDYVIIELGSRNLRVGLAGDALPRVVTRFGPEEQRRAGDYRKWQVGHDTNWRIREQGREWGEAHELWKMDLRGVDLDLVGDKIERAMREAFTKYLLIDSRPRRMALVLPSMLPQPLLSTILDTIFNNFQPPTISLLSSPVLTTVAAGLRAALVVDIGWAETVITGIYEYREVLCHRTIRASKLLSQEMLKFLGKAVLVANKQLPDESDESEDISDQEYRKLISFEECEDILARIAWCQPSGQRSAFQRAAGTLSDVEEEKYEIETSMQHLDIGSKDVVSIPLSSTKPPLTLRLPFSSLAKPCENALFADGILANDLDDEELPLHLLVYRTLLHLPVDVRSVCMSRIIFTGGTSNMPGLKTRVIEEVENLIQQRGWNPVQGTAIEKLRLNDKLRTYRSKQINGGPTEVAAHEQVYLKSPTNLASDEPEPNPYEDKLRRDLNKGTRPSVQGTLRAVESMGPWSGASLLCQLKVPAVSVVEREQWQQHGIHGATRREEINTNEQRQSMGPGGLRAGQGDRVSWTLGSWG